MCIRDRAAAALFMSGLLIGQRTSTSKFEKYLRPANLSDMDLITLLVNIDHIRGNMPMDHGISIPEVFFNYKVDQPQATVLISSEFEKASLDTVKAQIQEKYYVTYYS